MSIQFLLPLVTLILFHTLRLCLMQHESERNNPDDSDLEFYTTKNEIKDVKSVSKCYRCRYGKCKEPPEIMNCANSIFAGPGIQLGCCTIKIKDYKARVLIKYGLDRFLHFKNMSRTKTGWEYTVRACYPILQTKMCLELDDHDGCSCAVCTKDLCNWRKDETTRKAVSGVLLSAVIGIGMSMLL